MFGSELWWKGEATQGNISRASELQQLINQEAQAVTGCFRTTNLGVLEEPEPFGAKTIQVGEKTGSRSGISSPTRDAAERCLTSS